MTIAEGALVDAQVWAGNIVVAGTLTGEVTCCHRLEVLPSGRVAGTIVTGSIVIQEGGFIEVMFGLSGDTGQRRAAAAARCEGPE